MEYDSNSFKQNTKLRQKLKPKLRQKIKTKIETEIKTKIETENYKNQTWDRK